MEPNGIYQKTSSIALAFFRDEDSLHPHEGAEFNKVGYVTGDRTVVHLKGRRLVESRTERLARFQPKQILVPATEAESAAADFLFTRRPRDPDLFRACVHAIHGRNLVSLSKQLQPVVFENLTSEERRVRWERLLGAARRGDLLFTFDTSSAISRLIARVDRGPWSHTALCSGGGTVFEAITEGVCERPIEVYKTANFRLGLYRIPRTEAQLESATMHFRKTMGQKYSYRKALIAGGEKFFGLSRKAPTPNDLLMMPNLELIALV